MNRRSPWSFQTVSWLAGMAFSAFGLAVCITLLNLASRVIMGLGGFVATGGPYEIAAPAPEWVLLVPGSILSGFAFGGLSILYASRSGGFKLLGPVWSALFVSLGFQFGYMGLNPPGSSGIAWGWIICAVCFIPMGLFPIPGILKGEDLFGMGIRPYWMEKVWTPYDEPAYKTAYLVSVISGALLGLICGLLLFRLVTG